MSEKKIGDMTPDEKAVAVKNAVRRFQQELDESAEKIAKVLDEFEQD